MPEEHQDPIFWLLHANGCGDGPMAADDGVGRERRLRRRLFVRVDLDWLRVCSSRKEGAGRD